MREGGLMILFKGKGHKALREKKGGTVSKVNDQNDLGV